MAGDRCRRDGDGEAKPARDGRSVSTRRRRRGRNEDGLWRAPRARANLANDVGLLAGLLELGLLEVRRGREGRREDLLRLDVERQPLEQPVELLLVPSIIINVTITVVTVNHRDHRRSRAAQHQSPSSSPSPSTIGTDGRARRSASGGRAGGGRGGMLVESACGSARVARGARADGWAERGSGRCARGEGEAGRKEGARDRGDGRGGDERARARLTPCATWSSCWSRRTCAS